ncbi:MAG: phospholipase D-like domain-containing protein [Deltaproteobacteria bacterium]|nr:phospholipase D-like domain-containing protein [Deltaproteobacteria bacterium]
MKRAHGVMRRMITAAFLLILLFLPQAGSAAQPGGKPVVASPRAVAEVKLLLDSDYFTALLNGIDRARAEISLSAYLFRTIENAQGYPEAVLKSLVAAVRRGVRVEAILERNRDADDLSRNNAETTERLRQEGIRVCLDAPDRQTHTKLVVIDRRYVLIGSHNLTQSALKYNHEASVWIDSAPLAEETLRYMKSLCPDEWK